MSILVSGEYRSSDVGALLAPSSSFDVQRVTANRFAIAIGSMPGSGGTPRRWPADVVRWVMTAQLLLTKARLTRREALDLTVGARDATTKWIVIADGRGLPLSSSEALTEELRHIGGWAQIVAVPDLPT